MLVSFQDRLFSILILALGLLLTACGGETGEQPEPAPTTSEAPVASASRDESPSQAATPAGLRREDVPASMRSCFGCHRDVVAEYLHHGMAASVGPVGEPEAGSVRQPATATTYELTSGAGGAWLTAQRDDGGQRRQRLVGRIGAGIFDISWVGEEVSPHNGQGTGRLFFAPVETVSGHGLELSPFEHHEGAAGLDMALTAQCLDCHTVDRLEELPAAATRDQHVFPPNALGTNAFEHLEPLGCGVCHGETQRHVEIMAGLADEVDVGDVGLQRLGRLTPAQQRDTCARCHLQGDARLRLVEAVDWQTPQAGQWPVLVPEEQDDDFRFVGQLERLVLSPCFQQSPEMTCTTCHAPHQGVAEQGLERLEAACIGCHQGLATGHGGGLAVEQVAGNPARTEAGCVDCHVRRSQPFDLPHVRTADHFIRSRIALPEDDLPHRQFADPQGPLKIFDDGRLAAMLDASGRAADGERWRAGVTAMGLMTLGRFEEAAELFDRFPAPGSAEARRPTAPAGLPPLETFVSFHQMRALSFQTRGDRASALAAYDDALKLDPSAPGPRLARARLKLDVEDFVGAVQDSQWIIDRYPEAEAPWDLRAQLALRLNDPRLAAEALEKSLEIWPPRAIQWLRLAKLQRALGRPQDARESLDRAYLLEPSLPGLREALEQVSPGG